MRQTLRCAEEVLAEHPDSALTLLTPLDTMSLAGEEQAWYAVLRTQADYKLNHPVTDSLPLPATARTAPAAPTASPSGWNTTSRP